MRNKILIVTLVLFSAQNVKADLWGGDLPLLHQIITNTLGTLNQLRTQTSMMRSEMAGIEDRIYRIATIADIVQPSQWDQWKNPEEAIKRLNLIYQTLPKEYRSAKSDEIESEISKALNLVARVGTSTHTTFLSGKELEARGANSSPGVAQKLTASGIGTLVTIDTQNQVILSHITSLIAQSLAEANEKENRGVISKGQCFNGIFENLGAHDGKFSTHAFPAGVSQ